MKQVSHEKGTSRPHCSNEGCGRWKDYSEEQRVEPLRESGNGVYDVLDQHVLDKVTL